MSDWGLQQFPGLFIDDIEVSTGEGSTSFEDDGDQMDGWTIPGAPQDLDGIEGPNRNDWVRRGGLGINEGAVIRAADTLYMGFGFEGITGADTRNEVMDRAVDYSSPKRQAELGRARGRPARASGRTDGARAAA